MRVLFLLVGISVFLTGCGKPADGPTGVEVAGKVTTGTTPLANGVLQFAPDTGLPVSTMVVEGKYIIRLAPGKYRVTLLGTATGGDAKARQISEKYRKGVPVEINGPNSALDFDLSK